MRQLFQVEVNDLHLGPCQPTASGASAKWTAAPRAQTPWMQVRSLATYDQGKTAMFLATDARTQEWVGGLEAKAKQELDSAGLVDVEECWKAALVDDVWKLNVSAAAPRFGDPLAAGVWVAAVVELVGVWLFERLAGVQVKVVQIKALSGRKDTDNSPPTPTALEAGCSLDTSAEGDSEAAA